LITAIWRRNYRIAQYLIQSDKLTSINAKDINDENALYKAISQGYFDLVQSLHEKGAEFHRPRPLSSPTKIPILDPQIASFFEAVERNDFKTAKQLIDAEEDQKKRKQMVNQVKKPYERTLLSIAAEKGNKELVKLLVENKANLFAINNHGRTPKEMVLQNIYPEVYEYLDEQEKKVNPKFSEDELRHRHL
jgi:ankyrin repeat protein